MISDNELFNRLKNELIDGTNSFVDQYNRFKTIKNNKYEVLDDLYDKILDNYTGLFRIYKNGNGIKEADKYLCIGKLHMDIINVELYRIHTKKNIILARLSVGFGLLSVILAIVAILSTDINKNSFFHKNPTNIENKIELSSFTEKRLDLKIGQIKPDEVFTMQTVHDFLKKAGTYYLATINDDKPEIRPFSTINLFDGRLYIQTGKKKMYSSKLTQIQR